MDHDEHVATLVAGSDNLRQCNAELQAENDVLKKENASLHQRLNEIKSTILKAAGRMTTILDAAEALANSVEVTSSPINTMINLASKK